MRYAKFQGEEQTEFISTGRACAGRWELRAPKPLAQQRHVQRAQKATVGVASESVIVDADHVGTRHLARDANVGVVQRQEEGSRNVVQHARLLEYCPAANALARRSLGAFAGRWLILIPRRPFAAATGRITVAATGPLRFPGRLLRAAALAGMAKPAGTADRARHHGGR
jgi:hypothetical protein